MPELLQIILYTTCAGAGIPIGGVLAQMERIRPRWLENELRHSVIAFGGGILLAAVALVLVPEGGGYVDSAWASVALFVTGGACFFLVERALGTRRREKPQLMAMLLDFVPESLALGGAFAVGSASAPLLALFIGLQNLPEGFNAYRELRGEEGQEKTRTLGFMLALVPIGPVVGIIGFVYLSQYTWLLGATMLFASGGILYLIFQDIAPQSRMRRHWAPPLGAVLGFSVGLLGHGLLVQAGH
jgi:ZIP family zinc transporter